MGRSRPLLRAALGAAALLAGGEARATHVVGEPQPLDLASGAVVFDFEEGLGGWDLLGSSRRAETTSLGGSWAIWLDPGQPFSADSGIAIVIDLTEVGSISMDYAFDEAPDPGGLVLRLLPDAWGVMIELFPAGGLESHGTLSVSLEELRAIPILYGDPYPFEGPHELFLYAHGMGGFVDDVTFHPIPEPGSGLLLAGGLATLAGGRRRRPGGAGGFSSSGADPK